MDQETWTFDNGEIVTIPTTISSLKFKVVTEDEKNEFDQKQYTVALGQECHKLPWYLLRRDENPVMVTKRRTQLQQ